MSSRCADCKFAYYWDDRIRCNKVRKIVNMNDDSLITNVCIVLNPADTCYFYEERTQEITLDFGEDIANPKDIHKKIKDEKEMEEDTDGRSSSKES